MANIYTFIEILNMPTPLFEALQARLYGEAAWLLISKVADINQVIDKHSGETYLHWAVRNADVQTVKFLLEYKAQVSIKNKKGKTPIQLALEPVLRAFHEDDKKINHQFKDILILLIKYGAVLPPNLHNLGALFVMQPDVNVIQLYDEKNKEFKEYFTRQTVQDSKKHAAILFFGKHDHTPDSPYFGSMQKYYDKDCYVTEKYYDDLAQKLLIFRALICNILAIERLIKEIKELLSSDQEIKLVMITAHGNDSFMRLGPKNIRNRYSCLEGEDYKNKFVMTKTFPLVSKEGTIVLNGCSTAAGIENITKKLSEIAEGRIVFGANTGISKYKYIHFYSKVPGKNSVLLPFFGHERRNFVKAYKNGVVVADCDWVDSPRAKL